MHIEISTASACSVVIHLQCLKVLGSKHLSTRQGWSPETETENKGIIHDHFLGEGFNSLFLKLKIISIKSKNIGLLVSPEALRLLPRYLFNRKLITSNKVFFICFRIYRLQYSSVLYFAFLVDSLSLPLFVHYLKVFSPHQIRIL